MHVWLDKDYRGPGMFIFGAVCGCIYLRSITYVSVSSLKWWVYYSETDSSTVVLFVIWWEFNVLFNYSISTIPFYPDMKCHMYRLRFGSWTSYLLSGWRFMDEIWVLCFAGTSAVKLNDWPLGWIYSYKIFLCLLTALWSAAIINIL